MKSQNGATMIMALIFILIMSIIAMASSKSSTVQEFISGNYRDLTIAFQSAESALRYGEDNVSPRVRVLPNFDGTNGLYQDLDTTPSASLQTWSEQQWSTNSGQSGINVGNKPPRYVVEKLNSDIGVTAALDGSGLDATSLQVTGDPISFRITGHGYGITDSSEVDLQTIYRRLF